MALSYLVCLWLGCICLGLPLGAQAELLDGGISADMKDLCDGMQSLDNSTIFLNETYYIYSGIECRVEDVQNLKILGDPNVTTAIQCNASAIFSFVNVTSLSIEDVHFVGCGATLSDDDLRYIAETSSRLYFSTTQTAALLCSHCKDLSLRNVGFSNSVGYSFVGINLHGYSTLDGVQVVGDGEGDSPECSEPGDKSNITCSNGGMLLFFADSDYMNGTLPSAEVVLSDSSFHSNSVWKGNLSTDWSWLHCVKGVFETYIKTPDRQNTSVLPSVGALTIAYTQTQMWEANVQVLNSDFRDNHGLCFGAVFVLIHTSSVHLAHQQFDNCSFFWNSPRAVPEKDGKNYFGNDVTVYMQYIGQHFMEGQCLSMTSNNMTSSNESSSPSISVIHFPSTHGICGVYLEDLRTNKSTNKLLYVSGVRRADTITLLIKDIKMIGSKDHRYSLRGLDLYNGLLMFIQVANVTINGTSSENCQLSNLLGPAIILRSSYLFLTGTMLFSNIHASAWANGAAIQLQSASSLWFQEPLHAEFCNNSAVSGGAISSEQLVTQFCIFQYLTQRTYTEENIGDMNISIVFTSNRATVAGNSIYVEGLFLCSIRLSPSLAGIIKEFDIYRAIFHFLDNVTNGLQQMSSTPNEICQCGSDITNTSKNALSCSGDSVLNVAPIVTYPGKSFLVTLIGVDEDYRPVYTNMYSRLLSRDENGDDYYYSEDFPWRLGFGLDIVKIYGYCTQVNFSIFLNSTEYHSKYSNGTLSMYPFGKENCLALPIILKPCPYGYALGKKDRNYGCQCGKLLRSKNFDCDINDEGVRRPYTDVWVGVVSNGTETGGSSSIGYSSDCPVLYCNENHLVDIQNASTICRSDRVGILCGQCPEGLSTVIGSSVCKKCSNWWLFLIPLFALAGIVLVCLLFLLRLTVATGTINGLILFANIYNLSIHHLLEIKSTVWLSIFINLLNLKLGVPLCLYNGLTSLFSTYLSFVVPIYLWLIVAILILLSRRFQAIARLTHRSAIPVVATIIHLSFSKLLSFVGNSLAVIYLNVEDFQGKASIRSVWYFDGSVKYLSGGHAGLFLLSLISLLFFLLPYTVFLTGIRWFARFKFTNHVKPFVDAFCAPYKDRWRFWFGARLWLLIIFYIWSVSLRNYVYVLTLIKAVSLLLFTVVQVAIMPYKNILINYLDIFFLVDLTLLYIMSLYDEHYEVTFNLLLIPVFLVFCLIIAYHIYLVTGKNRRIRKLFLKVDKSAKVYDNLDTSDTNSDRVSEKSSLSSAPKSGNATYATLAINVDGDEDSVRRYRPGELREPLLESDSESNG